MYRMNPFRWVWVGFGVLCLIAGSLWIFSSLYRHTYYPGSYYGMPMMGWGGGWMMVVGVFGFVFLFLLFIAALRYVLWDPYGHRVGCGMGGVGWSGEAEEILRQRYARGEVSKEQYDQMLRDLREGKY